MKKILSVFIHLVAISAPFLMLSSCSDENEESEATVIYRLLDKDNNPTNVITYGDKMSFELIITNASDHEIKIDDERELYATAYCVYTCEGHYVGYASPTDELIMRPLSIRPGEQYRSVRTWVRTPIPIGVYYSPITIIIGNKVFDYKLPFKIQ